MHRAYPGFFAQLQSQLETLRPETFERLNSPGGLQVSDLLQLILAPEDHTIDNPDDASDSDVKRYSEITKHLTDVGARAYEAGESAFCILSGGAGTRFGGTKGLVKLADGKTLLERKLDQASSAREVWVMVSPSNYEDITSLLASTAYAEKVKVFTQFEGLRLSVDNQVVFDGGEPSLYPCGHGDVIPALKRSGILDNFLASGGKSITICNVDNVLGSPDPGILGLHLLENRPVTCEVVRRHEDDFGGVLCSHEGHLQIVEQFRMSTDTNLQKFRWLNTNTMIINAGLDFDSIVWSWHRVRRKLGEQFVVQHERLLQDLTSAFQTMYVEVPREHRYLPVKTAADLISANTTLGI